MNFLFTALTNFPRKIYRRVWEGFQKSRPQTPSQYFRWGGTLALFALWFAGQDLFLSQSSFWFWLGGVGVIFTCFFSARWALIFGLALGASAYSYLRITHHTTPVLWPQYPVEGVFEVDSFIDRRDQSVRAYGRLGNLSVPSLNGERVLVILPAGSDLSYGQRWNFVGQIEVPFSHGDFDYAAYLKRYQVQGILKYPEFWKFSAENSGSIAWNTASDSRRALAQRLSVGLPSPHDRLAMGILVGVKDAPPRFIQDQFQKTGLQHILVVSGFNITVVMWVTVSLLRSFSAVWRYGIAMLVTIGFVFLAGADPPVVRAGVMGSIAAWAMILGRKTDLRNAVLLSALGIGVFSPTMVSADAGFWLSFLATVGIILLVPRWERLCPHWFPRAIWAILSVTVAAQLMILPLLIWWFGAVPWVGIVLNLLVEPLIPIIMGSAVLVIFGGSFYLAFPVLQVLNWPAYLSIEAALQLAYWGSLFPAWSPSAAAGGISAALIWGMVGLPLWLQSETQSSVPNPKSSHKKLKKETDSPTI